MHCRCALEVRSRHTFEIRPQPLHGQKSLNTQIVGGHVKLDSPISKICALRFERYTTGDLSRSSGQLGLSHFDSLRGIVDAGLQTIEWLVISDSLGDGEIRSAVRI